MKINFVLFFAGLALMTFGLYRISPLVFPDRKAVWAFLIQVAPLVIVFAVVVIWTYNVGGTKSLEKGFFGTFRITSSFFPTIAFLFPIMAFGGILAGLYQTEINSMLGGRFGYPGTLFAAFIVPSSNAVVGPVKLCWETPAFRPIILYFLTASALVCWPIFFFRVLGLTWQIGAQMYKVNWMVAVGIAPAFWLWSRAVSNGGWWKAISTFFISS